MDLPRRYRYAMGWWSIIFCVLLFGGCCPVLVHVAMHNTAGVIIDGLITLGPDGATVFYWCLAAVSAVFVLIALAAAVGRLAFPRFLELGTDALHLPHGLVRRNGARIAYRDLQKVWEVVVSRQRLLCITAGGRRFTVIAASLPNRAVYEEVRDFLAAQTHSDV